MHSPDAPRARRGPGPPARGLGSTPGSPPWTASGVDSLPCSLDDTHSPSSSADGERCVGRVGIIARNCDTCAVFECSSAASFQPPMMARPCTITPSNRTRRRTRSRTEEDGLQNPLEENVIEENRTFTPADLLLFQNGPSSPTLTADESGPSAIFPSRSSDWVHWLRSSAAGLPTARRYEPCSAYPLAPSRMSNGRWNGTSTGPSIRRSSSIAIASSGARRDRLVSLSHRVQDRSSLYRDHPGSRCTVRGPLRRQGRVLHPSQSSTAHARRPPF